MIKGEDFKVLVDELAELERRQAEEGGFSSPDEAARWQQIERAILKLLTSTVGSDERRRTVRIACQLPVRIHRPDGAVGGVINDVGAGGVFVGTDCRAQAGDAVDLELETRGALDRALRVQGKVAWVARGRDAGMAGLGVALVAPDDPAERRLRRFVIELLRKGGKFTSPVR